MEWFSPTELGLDLVQGLLDKAGESAEVVSAFYEGEYTQGSVVIAVAPIPGESDRLNLYPIYDIAVFSPSLRRSEEVACRIIDAGLMGYPVRVSSSGRPVIVDSVNVVASPAEIEWEGNSAIRRYVGTYQLVIRR